jgi:hypothetical protein
MERKFEADTREEANRKADDWWAKAKGVRFVHRSQIPANFGASQKRAPPLTVGQAAPLGGNRGESEAPVQFAKRRQGVVSSCAKSHLSRLQRMLGEGEAPRKTRDDERI